MSSAANTLALSAKTMQDIHLTCNPEITFFKKRCPKYTNFSTGQICQSIGSGSAALIGSAGSKAKKVSTVLQRTSDLIGPTYVRTVLPALNTQAIWGNRADALANNDVDDIIDVTAGTSTTLVQLDPGNGLAYVDEVGNYLIEEAEIDIGGHTMDRVQREQQYFEWHATRTDENLNEFSMGIGTEQERISRASREQVIYTPLNFWYTRYPAQYLPAIACQGHDIVFKMDGVSQDEIWGGHGVSAEINNGAAAGSQIISTTVVGDVRSALDTATQDLVYDGVFLDRAERHMFAKMMQEYLISQFQFQSTHSVAASATANKVNIKNVTFNHPTRHIVTAIRWDSRTSAVDNAEKPDASRPFKDSVATGNFHTTPHWNDFSNGPNLTDASDLQVPLEAYQLKINNYERFLDVTSGIGEYYNEVHPAQKVSGRTRGTFGYYYFFGQYGEGMCPSGSVNFSAIDNVELVLTRAASPLSKFDSGAVAGNAAGNLQAFPAANVYIYSMSLNVLKFVSGMAGLAYAN